MSNTEIDPGKRYPYGNNENFAPKTTLDGLTYGVNEKLSKDAALAAAVAPPAPPPVDVPTATRFIVSSAADDTTGGTLDLSNYSDEIDAAVNTIPGVKDAFSKGLAQTSGTAFILVVTLGDGSTPATASVVFDALKDLAPKGTDTGPVVNHVAAITEFRVPNK